MGAGEVRSEEFVINFHCGIDAGEHLALDKAKLCSVSHSSTCKQLSLIHI